MLETWSTLSSIILLTLPLQTNSACTRPALQKASDEFFSSAISQQKSTLKLSPTLKITQNNNICPTLDQTLWSNLTSFRKPFRLSAIDVDLCTISTFVVPIIGKGLSSTSTLASVRIKISESSQELEELEIVDVSASFPSLLPETAPTKWTAPEKTLGSATDSRAELSRIVDSYASGIQAGSNANTLTASNCTRAENGFPMPIACNALFSIFGFPVTSRRYVVDTETSVVQAALYFNQRKKYGNSSFSLWMHEYFKIESGRIMQIYAIMEPLFSDGFVDVWKGKKASRRGLGFSV